MSRIDEALKRAARLEVAGNFGGVAAEHADDAPTLERYAPEAPLKPSSVFPSERVIPLNGPAVPAEPVQPTRKAQPSRDTLVRTADADPTTLDQFRRLGAVLHDAQLQTGLKVLMVSSAVPGEGKTFAIVNLAVTFAESFHRRVLLIDGDLRRPTIHSRLGCPNEVGLADVLRSGSTSLPVTKVSPRLSVLTAGRPTSSPLAQLTSDRIRDVITDAAAHFDWVLIDTPPVALLPDAQLVARMTEGVLFVIAAKSTPYALVNRSIGELGPERIVGTVLNRVDRKSLTSPEYGGYY
jgi:capsular exopolysaccharide synthesis family protein